jgi:hypothetical protein
MNFTISRLRYMIAAFAFITSMTLFGGCKAQVGRNVIPYIPPAYYNCSETTVNSIWAAYWGHANPLENAESIFRGQVFVFKNITIDDSMLESATDNYIWINEIQCYYFGGRSAYRLGIGDKVDIVGVNERVSTEYIERLVFTGCVFLPAGLVQLPVEDTSRLFLPSY